MYGTLNAKGVCEFCGKFFEYYQRKSQSIRRFCSHKCDGASKAGIKFSDEHRNRISKARMGQPSWSKGKKIGFGNFEGKKHSAETKVKMSQWQIKRYEGHISNEELRNYIRRNYLYRQWRSDVFFRDNFTCQECGVRSGNGKAVYLEAHHCRISFSEIMNKYKITTIEEAVLCPELWDINNGLTLCVPCHDKTKKGRPYG